MIRHGATFMQMLKLLFASHFVFNKTFPSSNSKTLDFMQRYYMNIQPENGNKALQPSKSKQAVSSFANKLQLFHLPGTEVTHSSEDI